MPLNHENTKEGKTRKGEFNRESPKVRNPERAGRLSSRFWLSSFLVFAIKSLPFRIFSYFVLS